MFGDGDGEGLSADSWTRTSSQDCLESLEQLVRLMGGCGPPLYLYFISLLPGGWDRPQVTRQTRTLNLAEVVIAEHQDLLSGGGRGETERHHTLHSATRGFKVRSLASWVKISSSLLFV